MSSRSWIAGAVVLLVLSGLIYALRPRSAVSPDPKAPEFNPAENRYVDPGACGDCHTGISETYQRTGMSRSFSLPTTANTVGDKNEAVSFYHKASDSYFSIVNRDGRFYQRRSQTGVDGLQTNVFEKEIHFVLGSGNHARAFLHRTSRNTLVELPLGWYAENGGKWGMSPGYDRPDHPGFTRAITYGCMFCHNGFPESPIDVRSGAEPAFPGRIPEGVDCQRCHGPGGRHVETAGAPGASVDDIRKAIVNPARLSPERQIEVCMQCHLETTSSRLPNSMVRLGRGPFSYRPGEPLGDFILHFDHAAGSGREDKFEIAGAAYRLRQSECFLRSGGALGCTTCHNPHDIPRGAQAAAHYNSVCRQCHTAAFDQLVASARHPRSNDCTGCHMPRRRTEDVVHVVMTDHYIQRRKPARDLLAPLVERRETEDNGYRGDVVLYYPATLPEGPDKDLYLAAAQVSQKANLANGIPDLATAIEEHRPGRMEFYLQLADAWRDSGQNDKALPLYEAAVRREPQSLIALQRFGMALRSSGQPARAVEIFKRALLLEPGDPAAWHQLGLTYVGYGSTVEASDAFQKAIGIDPDLSEAHNGLGGVRLESGDLLQAEPEFREAIRIQPDYAEAHSNLANVLASAGRFAEARYHFETAIRLRPAFAAARFNYGVALSKMDRPGEALKQIEAALKYDPNFGPAREALQILKSRYR